MIPRFNAIFAVLVVAMSGCTGSGGVVDPAVESIVQSVSDAPRPERWAFTYQPDSASPFVSCLAGIDEVFGVVDLVGGAMKVEPRRSAPSIIVSGDAILMASDAPNGDGPWHELNLQPADRRAQLLATFGEVLTGYIVTGARTPDLNTTAIAALDIATTVTIGNPPSGVAGEAFQITVDAESYLAVLEANGTTLSETDRDRIPMFTIVVDDLGRVTAIVVDTSPDDPEERTDSDRYIVTANYDVETINIPDEGDRRRTDIASLNYPTPEESCVFGS